MAREATLQETVAKGTRGAETGVPKGTVEAPNTLLKSVPYTPTKHY